MLDVLKVGRRSESRVIPVKLFHPSIEVGVILSNSSDVAFEVRNVCVNEISTRIREEMTWFDRIETKPPNENEGKKKAKVQRLQLTNWIESNNGRVQTNIGFRHNISNDVILTLKNLFHTVERFE